MNYSYYCIVSIYFIHVCCRSVHSLFESLSQVHSLISGALVLGIKLDISTKNMGMLRIDATVCLCLTFLLNPHDVLSVKMPVLSV